MTTQELRTALRAIRLDRGWSYDQLAEDIQRSNHNSLVSAATVRRFLAEAHEPTERLAHQMRGYVARRQEVA